MTRFRWCTRDGWCSWFCLCNFTLFYHHFIRTDLRGHTLPCPSLQSNVRKKRCRRAPAMIRHSGSHRRSQSLGSFTSSEIQRSWRDDAPAALGDNLNPVEWRWKSEDVLQQRILWKNGQCSIYLMEHVNWCRTGGLRRLWKSEKSRIFRRKENMVWT